MNEENEKALREHPVFADLGYFQCDDGWFNILNAFGRASCLKRPVAVQVKEKFGSLRIYLSHIDPSMDSLVVMADILSATTCEVCGNVGQHCAVRRWHRTLCDEHRLSALEYLATAADEDKT